MGCGVKLNADQLKNYCTIGIADTISKSQI